MQNDNNMAEAASDRFHDRSLGLGAKSRLPNKWMLNFQEVLLFYRFRGASYDIGPGL